MAEATKHLPAHRPTEDHELPAGRKNWDTPPQQIDGPEGPEPHPTPEEAGAGVFNSRKKPQQVQAAKADDHIDEPPPTGETYPNDPPRPQQIDGPEGPDPTDGTELIAAVGSQEVTPTPPNKMVAPTVRAKKRPAPAKTADTSKDTAKDGDK
jgi:hypothetical protein